MKNIKKPDLLNRRRFLLVGLAAGGAAALGFNLVHSPRKEAVKLTVGEDAALFRNPAYNQQKSGNGIVISTTMPNGKRLRLQMDDAGAFLWEKIATPRQYVQGTATTVSQLVSLALIRFKDRDAGLVKAEALAFLKEALAAGVVLGPGQKIYETVQPRSANG